MHTKAWSLIFCCLFSNRLMAQLPPIGQWREHYNWSAAMQLVDGEQFLWCATGTGFFSIDEKDQSIQTYGKLDGLSSIGISKLGWESGSQTLVAAFTDGNIDLLKNGSIKNIPDFKLSATPDKKINSITCNSGLAYLGTQIGLLVIDLQKKAIKDTYIIGNNGQKTAVLASAFFNNRLFAFDSEGIKSVSLASPNLADYRNWSIEKSTPLAKNTDCFLLPFNNSLLAVASDSIFVLQNNSWNNFFSNGLPIISLSVNGKQLVLCQKNGIRNQCLLLNENGSQLQILESGSRLPQLQQALFWKGNYWMADSDKGLFKLTNNQLLSYLPNGPAGSLFGSSTSSSNGIWVVSGTGLASDSSNGIFHFVNNAWNSLKPGSGLPSNFKPLSSIVSDDVGKTIWAGSLGSGLISFDPTLKPTLYATGSGLEASSIQPGKYKVSGLCIDDKSNLWVANSEAPSILKVRKPDGKWFAFKPPFALNNLASGQVLADDYQQVWIQLENAQGLLLFNYGSTLENPSDDRWKWYQSGKGNGNLPDNNVLSLAKDQNGFVWVGTKKGLAVIQCTEDVFGTRGCEAVIPIVQTNNFAGYLLGNEEVSCLTVDGANRIWAGTRHGLWLLSEDGEKTYYRFNTSNSPLPSDSICSLTLDGSTGELFVGTLAGMVSFRSTATDPFKAVPKLQVFPQPVPPGYDGSIAIRGMGKDAVVKITELDGRLVYETRSLGGQAIWNGRNYKGEKMATGVYLVWIVADDKTARVSTKIVFIGK